MSEEITPPAELTGEARLEWDRIVEELAAAGRLDRTDRAIVSTYCLAWAAHQAAALQVARHGSVIKWPNGLPGPSPFYKVQKETATLLRGLLADLGLTPAARGLDRKKNDDAGALDF
jgi:P27 family predicted phage terminase small subunit